MTPSQLGTIVSLNYHEITKDARVLKQARALKNAGYDVHILCDWPEDTSQHDNIDGIKITRFRCFSPDGVTSRFFDELFFLDKSRDEIAKRYLPYASACEYISQIGSFLEGKFGPNVITRISSKHYKEKRGAERVRRLLDYLYLNVRMQFLIAPVQSTEGSDKSLSFRRKVLSYRKHYRRYRQNLFQAQSIVFAANLPEISEPHRVSAIHAHDIYCLPAGVLLSQKLGVPLIYDAHEYEPARATNMDPNGSDLPELIENDCFPYINRLITVSDGIGELYAKRYQGPQPTIIMNAPEIDINSFKENDLAKVGLPTLREKVGLDDDVPLIVFTGGIQRAHRGLDKVLEAMTYIPKAHLVSLGQRFSRNDNWFLTIARKFGVQNRVHLLPPVDARDVPAAISSATVSVIPIQDASLSYRYCLPNKLFEAAFAGIPICASNLPEMKLFIDSIGIGRTMDQTDPKDIAATLQHVIDNRNDYKITPAAKARLTEYYSWQRQAQNLCDLYRQLLST